MVATCELEWVQGGKHQSRAKSEAVLFWCMLQIMPEGNNAKCAYFP